MRAVLINIAEVNRIVGMISSFCMRPDLVSSSVIFSVEIIRLFKGVTIIITTPSNVNGN